MENVKAKFIFYLEPNVNKEAFSRKKTKRKTRKEIFYHNMTTLKIDNIMCCIIHLTNKKNRRKLSDK